MIMIRPIRNRHHSSQFTVSSRTLQTIKKSPLWLAPLSFIAPLYYTSHKSSMALKVVFVLNVLHGLFLSSGAPLLLQNKSSTNCSPSSSQLFMMLSKRCII